MSMRGLAVAEMELEVPEGGSVMNVALTPYNDRLDKLEPQQVCAMCDVCAVCAVCARAAAAESCSMLCGLHYSSARATLGFRF